jgi:endopeptidase La
LINIQRNKTQDILGTSDVTACIQNLNIASDKITNLLNNMGKMNKEEITTSLQNINNDLSLLFKTHGTESLDDFLIICFGNNNNILSQEDDVSKYELLRKYFHPTSYKVINPFTKKENNKKSVTIIDDTNVDTMKNLSCEDISHNTKQYYLKVYGVRMHLYHHSLKKYLIINGILDNVKIDYLNNSYIKNKQDDIFKNLPEDEEFKGECFKRFIKSLTLKDYLTNETSANIYEKYVGVLTNYKVLKQKPLNNLVKDFVINDLFNKRNTIIQLLINSVNHENKYLAYLLYDLLSNDNNGSIDTTEQTNILDSFPWEIKSYFKDAMKKTIEYNNELSNFDVNKIPLEQQICLLKVNDNVKEKAMMKLKEVKAKSEDSGSKARQYLDGLLKIPFNIYMKEPIMNLMGQNNKLFIDMMREKGEQQIKEKYNSLIMMQSLNKLKFDINVLNDYSKVRLIEIVKQINKIINENNLNINKINKATNAKKEDIKGEIHKFIEFCESINERKYYEYLFLDNKIKCQVEKINSNFSEIKSYMKTVKETLDNAVYGHNNAKRQIERIIGQWINGEQTGYCFGFEGAPGLGKTSLAKRGLSNCLKNEKGESRPFSMIQMGGDSNGSTLHGHNYTYVGATWGSIVQILIDNKCMNPIILIDEVDKISKTEHGREIVGILTHLLDPAQNDCFQDKYFTGIDLDLSKALFILSYNDVDAIDKILLDRIHRVKFNNLSIEDKLIISRNYILPEVYKKMGLEDVINISDEVIKYLVNEYTCEAGVRKLKEVLFEIVGEINLEILKNSDIPLIDDKINISIDDIKTKYFKDKSDIKTKKIHDKSEIGIINGLWANAVGQGGIIPIQVQWRPSNKFLDLHLTGMQGDVMKESMNVALTLAWELLSSDNKKRIKDENNKYGNNGVHIHCPEGSVPKDGPSAGAAITTAIYSLMTNKKINNKIAMTGEISLDGSITQIGGLDLKILGGIKAGINEFIYPEENEKDYNNFMEKYKDSELIKDIKFNKVNIIREVFDIIFEED